MLHKDKDICIGMQRWGLWVTKGHINSQTAGTEYYPIQDIGFKMLIPFEYCIFLIIPMVLHVLVKSYKSQLTILRTMWLCFLNFNELLL